MSYQTCENALLALMQGVTGFSSATVTAADAKTLAAGPRYALVLRHGGFSQEVDAGDGSLLRSWEIRGDLYVKHTNDSQVHADAVAARQAIMDKSNAYPTLNLGQDVIYDALLEAGDLEDEEIVVGSTKYQQQVLRWRVRESIDSNWQEGI
jgi:hypothetical protein